MAIMNLPSHFVWRRMVQKNMICEEKEEGGTSVSLGLNYHKQSAIAILQVDKALKSGPSVSKGEPKHMI